MCDTSQHHHLLRVDELRNAPLSSYFFEEVFIESHIGTSREKLRVATREVGGVGWSGLVWSSDMNELLE